MKITKKIHAIIHYLFFKTPTMQQQQQPSLPPKDPIYSYKEKDLTETSIEKLVPIHKIPRTTLMLIGCDIDYGTMQYWALAGIRKFILVNCTITANQLQHHLQQVTLPAAGAATDSYPSVEVIGCTFADNAFETLFIKPNKKLIFNEAATSPLGAGKHDFSFVFEKEAQIQSISVFDKMTALFFAPGKDGVLRPADGAPIPLAKHLQSQSNVKLTP